MPAAEATDPAVIFAAVSVFFIGGVVKGGLGFGLPLVVMSVLPLFVPVDLALALSAVTQPLTNIFQYGRSGLVRETLSRYRYAIFGLVAGIPVGALFFTAINEATLTVALGSLVMVFTVLMAINPHFDIPPARFRLASWIAGLLGGVVGALTTANGPVFVLYAVGVGASRRQMLALLGLLFSVSGLLISGAFLVIGILDAPRFALAMGCLPAAIAGMWIGDRWCDKIPARTFRLLVLAVLFVLGFNMVASTLYGG